MKEGKRIKNNCGWGREGKRKEESKEMGMIDMGVTEKEGM